MSNILSLKNITRTYHQGENALTVLNNLNLEIKQGEMVALVGPSGSGKTTLLQIAGLLDTPTSGEIFLSGENISQASDAVRTRARGKYLGFVYQFHHLLPEFSALENVVLPQLAAGISQADAQAKSEDLLAGLGLSARLKHRPAKLSGGEQQRVAIARALANDPVLLLADEPTGNLDAHTAEDVLNLFIKGVRERKLAALVATHNIELAKRMDRIVRLENGALKAGL
jgi:lipoprotein-releasing system ATP-binding protein